MDELRSENGWTRVDLEEKLGIVEQRIVNIIDDLALAEDQRKAIQDELGTLPLRHAKKVTS